MQGWRTLALLFLAMAPSALLNEDIHVDTATLRTMNTTEIDSVTSSSSNIWSTWGKWTKCRLGHRTRIKHCNLPDVCGDRTRTETMSCGRHLNSNNRRHQQIYLGLQRKQLQSDNTNLTNSFSRWTRWSKCSKKCTTIRKRFCRRRAICGRKVMTQSAYCYFEGSYCQHWIIENMQRRSKSDETTSRSQEPNLSRGRRMQRRDPDCGRSLLPSVGSETLKTSYRKKYLHSKMKPLLKILGGKTAAPGRWPWQVAVLNKFKEVFCGGTLVSLFWVVTAAHCVRVRLFVRLGALDLRARATGELELRVKEAVVHPRYDPDTVKNDIAMLRLPISARSDFGHSVACLPRPGQILNVHTSCYILGWGKISPFNEYGSPVLQQAQVSTVSQGVCRRAYWEYMIADSMVCAGRGGRDSCAGDSGGPLLCRERSRGGRYVLHGVTSFGDGCGKRGKYGIYTRIANYVPWIQSVLNRGSSEN